MKGASKTFALLILALLPLAGQAREPVAFANYIVHYNAFTSDILDPAIAQAYGIRRSHNRAVLTIAVQDRTSKKGVSALIAGSAVTLNQQIRDLSIREFREGEAIYYLADFPINNEEILDFTVNVTPQGASQPYQLRFRQQFFTDEKPANSR
jgi:hypothetical protein